jgi:filamentous hemagglutinin family protein
MVTTFATSRSSGSRKTFYATISAFCVCTTFLTTPVAFANPTGGVIAFGGGSINTSGNKVTITQTGTDKGIINWSTFNIDTGQTTEFKQKNSNSISLNRIGDTNPSSIQGTLKANGKVILINPNGIAFGSNASVDVQGLIATTAGISDDDFKNSTGSYNFNIASPNSSAAVTNQSNNISIKNNGLLAFVAPSVENSGTITANTGKVSLAGGDTFTIDLNGDGLVQLAVGSSNTDTNVTNTGNIYASGGTVQISTQTASNVVDNLINMDGVVEAKTVKVSGDVIVLSGETDAANGVDGGAVTITGTDITVKSTGSVKADAARDGGTVTINGTHDVLIESGAEVSTAAVRDGGSISITAGDDLFIEDDAKVTSAGLRDGGSIALSATDDLLIGEDAQVLASGVQDGGTIDITAGDELTVKTGAKIDTAGLRDGGSITLDGSDVVIEGSVQIISTGLRDGGNIAIDGDNILIKDFATIDGSGLHANGAINVGNPEANVTIEKDVVIRGNLTVTPSNNSSPYQGNGGIDQGIDDDTTPGGGDDTTPGGGDDTTPGGGDDTTPGGGDDTTPGGGDDTTPGGGDDTTPGGGDDTTPGGGDDTTPGGGDDTTPGGGNDGNGGSGNPNPGNGGNGSPNGNGNPNPGSNGNGGNGNGGSSSNGGGSGGGNAFSGDFDFGFLEQDEDSTDEQLLTAADQALPQNPMAEPYNLTENEQELSLLPSGNEGNGEGSEPNLEPAAGGNPNGGNPVQFGNGYLGYNQ